LVFSKDFVGFITIPAYETLCAREGTAV